MNHFSKLDFGRLLLIFACWQLGMLTAAAQDEAPLTIKVVVEGIADELHENALRFLTIERSKESDELEPRKVRQWFAKGKEEITAALQPYGYYRPQIIAKLDESQIPWLISYQVNSGPKTKVSLVNIEVTGEGSSLPDLQQAVAGFKPKKGDTLNHELYKDSKQAIFDALFDAGFLDVNFEMASLEVMPEQDAASIKIVVTTGPRYYFGKTRVTQDILDEQFVKKFLKIQEGEPFNTQQVIEQKLILDDSQYFATVEPYPRKEQADDSHHIPIGIETSPRKPRRYTWGMGYGTDTGPRVNAGIEFRRVNRWGHKVDTAALISPVIQNASLRYRIPFKNVVTDEIALAVRAEADNIDENLSERVVFSLERAENWWFLRRRMYIETTFETFETADMQESSRVVTPGIELSYQHLDNSLFATRGYRWLTDMRVASESLYSTVDFQRIFASAGWIHPLWSRSRFMLRGEFGHIETDDFSELPPPQRFYAGGARNVRGYGYRDLGPKDDQGSAVGGSSYLFGSMEADALLIGNFGLALFYDTGNVSEVGNIGINDERKEMSEHFELKSSVGVGLRWKSPVGMLRLDYSVPLDEENSDYQIHFSIGPDL